MAHLYRKGEIYLIRFRFRSKEYKRSLQTTKFADAEAALAIVKLATYRLRTGQLQIPADCDIADFIVSGGTLQPRALRLGVPSALSFHELRLRYLTNLSHLAESNRATIATHLGNLEKKLGAKANHSIEQIERRDLEDYLQARLRERAATTVAKERHTIVGFCEWLIGQGILKTAPSSGLTRIKSSAEASPFRTVNEIEAIIKRGGLSKDQEWKLWDCVYLPPPNIAELLTQVRQRSTDYISYLLHCIPAYTGMRRGEILRLQWNDVEFEQETLIARSRKQSRQSMETIRRIAMHTELKTLLLDWRQRRPRGQYVISNEQSLERLSPPEANGYFWKPLRKSPWCLSSRAKRFKIGFHTYRHSFASNLAAAGVDQRLIDEFMGHQTEAMRKRYRHLLPGLSREAMRSFSLLATKCHVAR